MHSDSLHGGQEYRRRSSAFSLYDQYGHTLTQESLPRGSQNLQFGYRLPCSSLLFTQFVCMMANSLEDFLRHNAFSLYDQYGHAQHRNPCPGGNEIYNFDRGFHAHHYFTISFSAICLGVEKKIFNDLHQFYSFYPKIKAPLGGRS